MKMRLLLILLLCNLVGFLSGQSEVVVLSDQSDAIVVSARSYFLEDIGAVLDPGDVVSGKYDYQFLLHDDDDYTFGNGQKTIWHRISIRNNDTTNDPWYLVVDNHHLDTVNMYFPDSVEGYKVIKSGRWITYDDRPVEFNTYAFPIDMSKGDQDLYIRLSCYYLNYPLKIMSSEALYKERSNRKFIFGIISGFLLMIALYNLFIYFTVRDINYIWFIIYVFLNMLSINTTYGNLDTWWQGNLFFMNTISPGILMLPSISGVIFAYYFLKCSEYLPRISKVFIAFCSIIWVIGFVSLYQNANLNVSLINQFMAIVIGPLILGAAIYIYFQGYKPARFYVIAKLVAIAGFFLYAFAAMKIIDSKNWIEILFAYGAGLEILLFSFALADMINEYKKEKQRAEDELVSSLQENEKLIKNQNRLLETRVKERTKELEAEKEKSEQLLLNILPAEVAEELKSSGETEAKHFTDSTIMFTDFVNFTGISADMDPIELVKEVNKCFTAFDHIVEQHDLEKIKTIGDAYLAVCGLPTENPKHAENVVNAAFAIRAFIQDYIQKGGLFDIRIGIHTGPLVAGVVGVKKFAYDIWGDSVNIASRLESASESGKINISQSTYELVKDICICEHRGEIPIKNRGEVNMYFIEPKT